MPHGNFDKPPDSLKRSASGDSAEACGPLDWDGDNLPAKTITIEHIEIRQESAHGHVDSNVQFERGTNGEWMVENVRCEGPAKFHDGSAHADARVTVILQDGKEKKEHWHEKVELSH